MAHSNLRGEQKAEERASRRWDFHRGQVTASCGRKGRQAVWEKVWVRLQTVACGCIWPVAIMTAILKGFVVMTVIKCPECSSVK